MTMTLISTVTVGSGGAANIDFTSIAGTGTDLLVVLALRSTLATTAADIKMTINGSSTTFTAKWLTGDSSAVSSGGSSSTVATAQRIGVAPGTSSTASTFGNFSVYFPNYATSLNKSWSVDSVSENNATRADQYLAAGIWATTSPITSLSFLTSSGANLAEFSTASLYKITKGSGGATVS